MRTRGQEGEEKERTGREEKERTVRKEKERTGRGWEVKERKGRGGEREDMEIPP